ncbi:MAG: hypothetical protein WD534_18070 [Phycisphaeraceae bacterium]
MEGDYKSPPPKGKYDARHDHARGLMKREPVVLSVEAREAAVRAIQHALVTVHALEVLAIAVGSMHLHVLVRLPEKGKPMFSKRGLRTSAINDPPRHYMGIAKKESAKSLAAAGLVQPGGIWARRGKIVPIRDRPYQVNVVHYILKHFEEGAAIWSFRDPDVVHVQKPTV